jgi:SAM-dependent methyltransferase
MVGSGQELPATRSAAARNAHVTWIDWTAAADLPALVGSHEVCLGIFGTGAKALRVVPNKVYQGAAAGCAVVTSDTAPQRAALGDDALLVPPGDAGRARSGARRPRRRSPARGGPTLSGVRAGGPGLQAGPGRAATSSRNQPEPAMTQPAMSLNAWLRYDVIRRHLRDIGPVGSVLEIGCGGGGLGARLAAASAYTGVELDDTSLDLARRRVAAAGGGRVLMGDERDVVAPEETFDLVCAFEVLEHIEDDLAALRTWTRRIRPGGHFMLSVPAGSDRFGPSDEMAGHYRRYDDSQLRAVLQQAGLQVVDLQAGRVPARLRAGERAQPDRPPAPGGRRVARAADGEERSAAAAAGVARRGVRRRVGAVPRAAAARSAGTARAWSPWPAGRSDRSGAARPHHQVADQGENADLQAGQQRQHRRAGDPPRVRDQVVAELDQPDRHDPQRDRHQHLERVEVHDHPQHLSR